MNSNLNFIGIRKLKLDLLLNIIKDTLDKSSQLKENLYMSILPPIEDLTLIEMTDFIPVTRYTDIDIANYLVAAARTFNHVYYLEKNEQTGLSKYQKFLKGKPVTQYKGEDALEKGIKFDLIINYKQFEKHIQKAWKQQYAVDEPKPVVYQLIRNGRPLETPILVDYTDYYGH
jgi:hypothetical protein